MTVAQALQQVMARQDLSRAQARELLDRVFASQTRPLLLEWF